MKTFLSLLRSRSRYASLIKPFAVASVFLAMAVLFAMLTDEVREGDTRNLDAYVAHLALVARARWPGLVDAMRDISGLGGTTVLTLLTCGCVGFLWLLQRRKTAMHAVASVVSGLIVLTALKYIVGRARPDATLASGVFDGLSYPSGHASMSAVVYLTLGALIASTRDKRAERIYVLCAASFVTLIVGLSRVALGAHWTTDVLAGWLFGSVWAVVWLLTAQQSSARDTN